MRAPESNPGRPVPASVGHLPRLIELLCIERGLEVRVPAEPRARWNLFRALVNTRPPAPAGSEFLALQDELLQDITAWRGITDAREIPAAARDGRLALWRGDITTLRADAIVNAANAQMLGCFVPGIAASTTPSTRSPACSCAWRAIASCGDRDIANLRARRR